MRAITDGAQNGELQNYLSFAFWKDDGDNVYETGETMISTLNNVLASTLNGQWHTIADSVNGPAIPGNSTSYVGKAWCFGTMTASTTPNDSNTSPLVRGTGFTCSGVGHQNSAQTDGLVIDVTFNAVQARNNGQFTCASLPTFNGSSGIVEVRSADLSENLGELVGAPNSWLFYNDTNNTVMTINQFAGNGGVNDIVAGPLGVGAAQMLLDTNPNPRYNIATYKYKDVKLSDITSLKYRIYDASASPQTPYLHFNVDFANNDTWQRRLVMVPTGVTPNTWTTVDAINGGAAVWTYSGPTWPAGIGEPGSTPGTTGKTWAQILATYPNAETRSTDSFFGVRVGHPGPNGENSYVDWIEVNGEKTDFVI